LKGWHVCHLGRKPHQASAHQSLQVNALPGRCLVRQQREQCRRADDQARRRGVRRAGRHRGSPRLHSASAGQPGRGHCDRLHLQLVRDTCPVRLCAAHDCQRCVPVKGDWWLHQQG